jgi:microcystin-dependent protein
MATVTRGKTFTSGETVEVDDMHNLVDLATVTNIVNADISESADIAGSKLLNGSVASAKFETAVAQALVPAGAVMPFAMNTAPSGWLAANGSAVNRTTYAALFAAVGTVHGVGDGSTTFNLPDLRGIFVRGTEQQTISGTTYGATSNIGLKQQDELKSHTHTGVPSNNIGSSGGAQPVGSGGTTGATGGAETRPANIALLYCIKF